MTGPTLTAPFKNETKDPRGFTYIPVEDVIERLNLVLGEGGWSFECELVHVDEHRVAVKGRLSALGVVKEQFGGQNLNKNKDGFAFDLGNDMKGAASDALKKCAQQIGVGLYIPLGHTPRTSSGETSAVTPAGTGEEAPPTQPVSSGPVPSAKRRAASKQTGREEVGDTHDGGVTGGSNESAGDPETRKLIEAYNRLPLDKKAEVTAEKRRLGVSNWFDADLHQLAALKVAVYGGAGE
jgi:hypothetical protein